MVTDIKEPTIVETTTKEVFDEFYYKGEEIFKKIKENYKLIQKLENDSADLITEYIDMVEMERKKQTK